MGRQNPPDHRGPEAVAGLAQRRRERGLPTGSKRRLSDREILMLAAPDAPVDERLVEGQRVLVLFSVQDPIEGKIVDPPDRNGWVKVEQDFMGEKLQFLALASCCVVIDGE